MRLSAQRKGRRAAPTLANKATACIPKKLPRVTMLVSLIFCMAFLMHVSLYLLLLQDDPTVVVVPADVPQAPFEYEVAVRKQQQQVPAQQRQNLSDANPNWNSFQENNERACRVIIENVFDFHHEVIESVVRRFPLHWDSMNCTIAKPVIYDFALFDNRFPDRIPFYIGKPPKYLNQTEFWGWKTYFEKNLQHKIVLRAEQSTTTIPSIGGDEEPQINSSATTGEAKYALFNKLILYEDYGKGPIDAIIDVTCGDLKTFKRMRQSENAYCLLHEYYQRVEDNDYMRSKSCWISPMHPKDHCFFLPLDLPKFQPGRLDKKVDNDNKGIQICAPGGGKRNQKEIIEIFSKIPHQEYNARLTILARKVQPTASRFLKFQKKAGLFFDKTVEFVSETDYEAYALLISQCDVFLPMADPLNRQEYFPQPEVEGGGRKKLTGAMPLIIAYQLPTVMHAALEEIYRPYLSKAPVETYSEETVDSRAAALTKMVQALVRQ